MTKLFIQKCIVKTVDIYCIYLLTWLASFFWVDWQNLYDLKLDDHRYAIGCFHLFDSDWESGSIFNVYLALE